MNNEPVYTIKGAEFDFDMEGQRLPNLDVTQNIIESQTVDVAEYLQNELRVVDSAIQKLEAVLIGADVEKGRLMKVYETKLAQMKKVVSADPDKQSAEARRRGPLKPLRVEAECEHALVNGLILSVDRADLTGQPYQPVNNPKPNDAPRLPSGGVEYAVVAQVKNACADVVLHRGVLSNAKRWLVFLKQYKTAVAKVQREVLGWIVGYGIGDTPLARQFAGHHFHWTYTKLQKPEQRELSAFPSGDIPTMHTRI